MLNFFGEREFRGRVTVSRVHGKLPLGPRQTQWVHVTFKGSEQHWQQDAYGYAASWTTCWQKSIVAHFIQRVTRFLIKIFPTCRLGYLFGCWDKSERFNFVKV